MLDFRRHSEDPIVAQHGHAALWKELGGCPNVLVHHTIKGAFDAVMSSFSSATIIVAGSLYLAGTVRYLVNKQDVWGVY